MTDYQRLSHEELENRINATKAYVRRQYSRREESKDPEVELCYLEREQEHRDLSSEIHKSYVAELEKLRREEEEALRENDQEEADYDS